jgi:hypothetical protein
VFVLHPLPLSSTYDKDLLHPISPTKQPFVFPNREIYPVIFLRIIGLHVAAVGAQLTSYLESSALKMHALKAKTLFALLPA